MTCVHGHQAPIRKGCIPAEVWAAPRTMSRNACLGSAPKTDMINGYFQRLHLCSLVHSSSTLSLLRVHFLSLILTGYPKENDNQHCLSSHSIS